LKKALEGIQVVVHCAARVTTPFSDQMSHSFEQINHWGTAELVYAMEEMNVPHLIHISSSSVYGSNHEMVGVGHDTNSKTFYGISKKRAEDHANRLMNKGVKTHILRCGNVYGFSKSMRFDTVINKMLFDAHFKGRISIHGSGDQFRAFIHIDTVSKIIAELTSDKTDSGTYDLVENNYRVNEIALTMKEIYPELEMLFIDQNMKMREIQVRPDKRLSAQLSVHKDSLKKDLIEAKEQFSF
jgi:UDP-glucose 4-epimerase